MCLLITKSLFFFFVQKISLGLGLKIVTHVFWINNNYEIINGVLVACVQDKQLMIIDHVRDEEKN